MSLWGGAVKACICSEHDWSEGSASGLGLWLVPLPPLPDFPTVQVREKLGKGTQPLEVGSVPYGLETGAQRVWQSVGACGAPSPVVRCWKSARVHKGFLLPQHITLDALLALKELTGKDPHHLATC